MNELVLSPEWQSDHSTFQWVNRPNDRLCPPPPLFPGKLINPIVVSCLDRTEFCDWIQHFKAADVPVLTPPPPVYDIIYTPTHREVKPALLPKTFTLFTAADDPRLSPPGLWTCWWNDYEKKWKSRQPTWLCQQWARLCNDLWVLLLPRSSGSLKQTLVKCFNIYIYIYIFCPLISRLHSLTDGVEPAKDKGHSDSHNHQVDVGPITFSYPFMKTTLSRQGTLNPFV